MAENSDHSVLQHPGFKRFLFLSAPFSIDTMCDLAILKGERTGLALVQAFSRQTSPGRLVVLYSRLGIVAQTLSILLSPFCGEVGIGAGILGSLHDHFPVNSLKNPPTVFGCF